MMDQETSQHHPATAILSPTSTCCVSHHCGVPFSFCLRFIYFILYAWMFCLHVRMSPPVVPGGSRGQKTALGLRNWSYEWLWPPYGCWKENLVLWEQVLLTAELPPPYICWCWCFLGSALFTLQGLCPYWFSSVEDLSLASHGLLHISEIISPLFPGSYTPLTLTTTSLV